MPAVAFITTWWQAGVNVLLFIAGLRNISSEIYAAAELDGATRWQVFARITWPLDWPITVLVAIGLELALGAGRIIVPHRAVSGPVELGIRPEHNLLTDPGQGRFDGRVSMIEQLGNTSYVYLDTPSGPMIVEAGQSRIASGQGVGLQLDGAPRMFLMPPGGPSHIRRNHRPPLFVLDIQVSNCILSSNPNSAAYRSISCNIVDLENLAFRSASSLLALG